MTERPFRLRLGMRYGAARAQQWSGATPRQLRYWDRIGLARPSYQATDGQPGRPRLYSAVDLERLAEIVDRLLGGDSLQHIRATIEPQPAPEPEYQDAVREARQLRAVIADRQANQQQILEARRRIEREYAEGIRVRRVGA